MRRSRALPASLLAVMGLAPMPQPRAASLASAPIDAALFRDGEVHRSQAAYDRWTLVCDAIPRLGHRFCSLKAAPATLGTATLDLTVSTGDDGRPAALVRLPFGLSLPFGVRVKALGPGAAEAERRIGVALCSAASCEAVWTLSAGDLAALKSGAGLRLTVQGWRFAPGAGRGATPRPATTTVGGSGFAAAIAASLR